MKFSLITLFILLINYNVNASLLKNVETKEKNILKEIIELLLPISTYDPEIIKIEVNEKGLGVFKSVFENLDKTGFDPVVDDNNIYKWLNAKEEDILLRIPVRAYINPNHITKIKKSLTKLADFEERINGLTNKRVKWAFKEGKGFLKILVGAIKGNPRVKIPTQDIGGNPLTSHYTLGLTNSSWLQQDVWVHKPFTYYGFNKQHNKGKLCERVTEKIAQVTKPKDLWDHSNDRFPGHQKMPWWSQNYPAITIEFLDKNKKVINSDYIVHFSQGGGSKRHTSFKGWKNNTYQSIITEDTENGWHPQDGLTRGMSINSTKYSAITNLLNIHAGSSHCAFNIIENTNFLIVTKINKNIIKNTDKIIVKYSTVKPDYKGISF